MAIQASDALIEAVKRYQAGDTAAFDTIYYESSPYVTKCVLNVLHKTVGVASEDLQQDILQDTYLTIAEKLPQLQEPGAFLQWAGRIATHIAERTWQKDARQHEMETSDEEMTMEVMDEAFIPEDILLNKEKQALIRQALEELPTNQYLCVVEYFYNGLKEREIAEKLDMPVNTVKTNLSRAKKKLRGVIETKQKKSGIKLYNMAWLLLLLLRKDLFTFQVPVEQEQAVLAAVHAQLGMGVAAAGASAGASAGAAAAGAASSGSASAGAATAAGTSMAVKVTAIALAGTLTAGAAIGIPLAARDRQPDIEETQNIQQIPEDAFRYGGHSYYVYTDQCDTWEAAQAFCEALGGHLAVITTEEENAAVHGYLTGMGLENAYLGLYLDPEVNIWKWVDGEAVAYTNWAPGEPSNDYDGETYAMFYYRFPDGTWNDGNFGHGTKQDDKRFLCEWD